MISILCDAVSCKVISKYAIFYKAWERKNLFAVKRQINVLLIL